MPQPENTEVGRSVAVPTGTVRRRRVFYISGFDPRGPNHYHALYRAQAEAQGRLTGQRLKVGPAERVDRLVTRWCIEDASGTVTEYDFLRWDDLIRSLWHRRYWSLVLDYLAVIGRMRSSGVTRGVRRLTRGGWLSLYFPLMVLVGTLLAPTALATAAWWWLSGWVPMPASIGCAAVLAFSSWWLLRVLGERLNADWVMRCAVFAWRGGTGEAAGVAERTDRFAERIAAARGEPGLDEVVVVGHSLGAQIAIEALGRALQGPAIGNACLGLLTLGHTLCLVPMQRAERLRAGLEVLGVVPGMNWVDVSAPPDRVCCPHCDPRILCGLPAVADRPRLLPARFHRQFTPLRYKVLRENRYRIHFQYLMAAEVPAGFDYFRTTAGPHPLSAAESP